MCPQKWYAAASPGATSDPIVFAPATPITAVPTRARKPRRELDAATASARRAPDAPTALTLVAPFRAAAAAPLRIVAVRRTVTPGLLRAGARLRPGPTPAGRRC